MYEGMSLAAVAFQRRDGPLLTGPRCGFTFHQPSGFHMQLGSHAECSAARSVWKRVLQLSRCIKRTFSWFECRTRAWTLRTIIIMLC